VQASGLGENGSFGGMSHQQLLAKRVYYFEYDRSEIQGVDRAAILLTRTRSLQVKYEGIARRTHRSARQS